MITSVVFMSSIVALAAPFSVFSFLDLYSGNYTLLCGSADGYLRCNCPTSDLENTLDCSHKRITELPNDIRFPSHVTIVSFTNNKISALSSTVFTNGLAVEYMDLSFNHIDFLASDVFVNLVNLKEINLSNNLIWSLSLEAFRGPQYLLAINLAYNKIGDFYPDVFQVKHLQELRLSYNPLMVLHKDSFRFLKSLKILDLSSTGLSTLPEDIFSNNIDLHMLDLSDNSIWSVPTKAISSANNLKHLVISGNPIEAILSRSFVGLRNLEILTITSMSKLTSLEPHSFIGLTNLKELFLNDNLMLFKISGLAFKKENLTEGLNDSNSNDEVKVTVPSLKKLILRNCALVSLPEDLLDWSKLEELDLSHNPWACDCHLSWMAHDTLPQNVKELTQCVSPSGVSGKPLSSLEEADFTCSCLTYEATVGLTVVLVAVAFVVILVGVIYVLSRRSGSGSRKKHYGANFTYAKSDLEWDPSAEPLTKTYRDVSL